MDADAVGLFAHLARRGSSPMREARTSTLSIEREDLSRYRHGTRRYLQESSPRSSLGQRHPVVPQRNRTFNVRPADARRVD